MDTRKEKFYIRLKEAFQEYKKEICFILVIVAIILEIIPDEVFNFSPGVKESAQSSLIFSLILICIEVLFDIFNKLKDSNKQISIVESPDLIDRIYNLTSNENRITIKYIAIAGTTGWGTVLSKFLDKNDKHSLLNKKIKIDIALIDNKILDRLETSRERYESVTTTVKEIQRIKRKIDSQKHLDVSINLYRYNHLPNFVGYLINDNYLFTTLSYWEVEDGSEKNLVLRGGRRPHIIYDKNDGFGGAYYIQRFNGWFEYIQSKENQPEPTTQEHNLEELPA
ncbi:hypothetical protein [Sessilibacter corallicola]|uniref:hypothetical protein n=1 Tax=Sessilibacter corallicola TaxID=2904075 RepID=UPI001E34AA78|nr:hypothetical protein [Sessilibacter corallicola]MCE2028518.1 hypothetical protein [Sessilibacter corallicola]